eukprot:scaffold73867_cov27-Tisochrysis_lutea.AAC.1
MLVLYRWKKATNLRLSQTGSFWPLLLQQLLGRSTALYMVFGTGAFHPARHINTVTKQAKPARELAQHQTVKFTEDCKKNCKHATHRCHFVHPQVGKLGEKVRQQVQRVTL